MIHSRIMHPCHYCITDTRASSMPWSFVIFEGSTTPNWSREIMWIHAPHPTWRTCACHIWATRVPIFNKPLSNCREKCILHFYFTVNFYLSIYLFIYFNSSSLESLNRYVKINYFYIDILVIPDIIWIKKKKNKKTSTPR